MAKRNNISTEVRYDFITKQAYLLLNSLGVISLPIDPFAIIKSCCWTVLTVEEAEEYGVKCPFKLNNDTPAINFKVTSTGERFIIYYDEQYIPRLRWSIAHEIGHIILDHKNEFPNKLTPTEYSIAEKEADKFAAELLAPTKILNSEMFSKELNSVAKICNISADAANNRLSNWNGIGSIHAASCLLRESEILYRNMYNYLLTISNYWENRLKETDIILSPQYEDFIFCDYWEYTKSKMKRQNKDLFLLLDDSLAFYDNTKMILFVKNLDATKIDNSQKEIILSYLSKYVNSSIRSIVSIQMAA